MKAGCNKVLLDRLEYLKQLFGIDEEIKIEYLPGQKGDSLNEGCRGRVEGSNIYLFEEDQDKALETLNHEFVHYLIRDSRNASIKIHNSDFALLSSVLEAYRRVTERALNDAEESQVERLGKGLNNLFSLKRLMES